MLKLTQSLALVLIFSLVFSTTAIADVGSSKYKTVAENLPYSSALIYNRDNLIFVSDGDNRGFIDYDGKIIVKPQPYADIYWENGYILTKGKDGSLTLYDNKGNIVMSPARFAEAAEGGYTPTGMSFSIGNNIVVMTNGENLKIVDFNGKTLSNLTKLLNEKRIQFYFAENLIRIYDYNNASTVYYFDATDNPVLPNEKGFSYMDFNDGVVLKTKFTPSDSNNELVTPLAFYDVKGKLVCNVPDVANGVQNYVSFSETDLATLLQFSEGYAAYEDKNTKLVGFIDKTGEIAIPAKFSSCVLKFADGVAGVCLPDDDRLSFIDTKGNVLFSIQWPTPWPRGSVNGLILSHYLPEDNDNVERNTVRDVNGNILYSDETTYENGKAIKFAFKFGSGAPVASKTISYVTVDPYSHTAIMQTVDNKYGLNDLSGNEILPPIYNSIQALDDKNGRLLLIKDSKISIIQASTSDTIATPEYLCKGILSNDGLTDGLTYQFSSGSGDYYPGDCLLMLNGRFMPYKVAIKNGASFVLMDAAAEAAGTDIKWDNNTQQVTMHGNDTTIVMTIDKVEVTVNGKPQTLSVAPFINNGLVYVPLRFVAETMGKSVGYIPSFYAGVSSGNFIAHRAVVWVDDPTMMNNDGKTQEQITRWLKDRLSKDEKLAHPEGNNDTFDEAGIAATSYIGQIGRYAYYKSVNPILVDMGNNSVYIVNLQNMYGAIYREDITAELR